MADAIPTETTRRTAGDVTRDILRGLFDVMLANEQGTRARLDPTPLHAFRVALRRTRSAISRLPGVLPKHVCDRFGAEFKWLGAVTSATRDYDVFLELLPTYEAALSRDATSEIPDYSDLGQQLQPRRDAEQVAMVEQLDSARYAELKTDWKSFLRGDPADWSAGSDAPDAPRPAKDVASQEIWRSFESSMDRASAIGDQSPDEDFHELRKDLKKLRYLLEFFREFFPQEEIDESIAALKTLQDILGEINDLAVQQLIVRELAPDQGLLPFLEARLRKQRESFPAAFAEVGSEGVRERFRALFG